MTRIKVCGIMNSAELLQAVLAGADAVGFVVEIDDSRHRLSAKEAADLIKLVPLFTKSVAVIAPDDVEGAVKLAKQTGADVLQIHGSLSAADLAELKGRIHQKLIAVVAAGSDLLKAQSYAASADAVLLDTLANGKLGGTGAVHDWNKSAEIARSMKVPVILAGGLNPGNVAAAIEKVRPYAVDVSSGLETGGKKDPEKIFSFVREVRACPLVEPVYVDVTDKVSVDAPLSLYLALRGRRYPYLLESVEKSGQKARFSFVGADPSAVVTVKNRFMHMEFFNGGMGPIEERLSECVDVEKKGSILQGPIKKGYDLFDALRAAIPCSRGMPNSFGRQVFTGGGIGYLAYDLVKERLGRSSTSETPDAKFCLAESTFIFDHLTRKVYFTIAPILPGPKVNLIETHRRNRSRLRPGRGPESERQDPLRGRAAAV